MFLRILIFITVIILIESCSDESLRNNVISNNEDSFEVVFLKYLASGDTSHLANCSLSGDILSFLIQDEGSSFNLNTIPPSPTTNQKLINTYLLLLYGYNVEAFDLINKIDPHTLTESRNLYSILFNETRHQLSIRNKYKLNILSEEIGSLKSMASKYNYLMSLYYAAAKDRKHNMTESAFSKILFSLELIHDWNLSEDYPLIEVKLLHYLALINMDDRNYVKAIDLLENGLKIVDKYPHPFNKRNLIKLHLIYQHASNRDTLTTIKLAEELYNEIDLEKNRFLKLNTSFTLINIYNNLNRDLALKIDIDSLVKEAVEFKCDDLDNDLYNYLAYSHLRNLRFDQALEYSTKAQTMVSCDSLRQIDYEFQRYLLTSGLIYLRKGLIEKNKDDFLAALDVFNRIFYSYHFTANEDISHYGLMVFSASQNILKTLFHLNSLDPNQEYLEIVFKTLSEAKNRSIKIADRKHQTKYYLNLTDKDQNRLNELTHLIESYLDSCDHFRSVKPFDSGFYKNLYMAYKEKEELLEQYPQEQLSIEADSFQLDLEAFQKKLNVINAQYIDYFFGSEYGFALSVTADTCILDTFDLSLVDNLARSFHQDLINRNTTLEEITVELAAQILSPYIDTTKDQLIICPDNVLNGIPFGAVKLNLGDEPLIAQMAVSYVTGPQDILKENIIEHPDISLLAYSNAETENNQLDKIHYELLYSDDECEEIAQLAEDMNVQFLSGKKINEKNFSKALESNIFHFAGHSQSGQASIHDNQFIIRDKKGAPIELPGYAIKQWSSNVDLAVLSSCESGIGQYNFGEGTYSLSRQFLLSGSKSVVKSLWKVNDLSTLELMSSFYEYLFEGYTTTESLQLAKLDLMQNSSKSQFKDPFYWSGFVLEGQANLTVKK